MCIGIEFELLFEGTKDSEDRTVDSLDVQSTQ